MMIYEEPKLVIMEFDNVWTGLKSDGTGDDIMTTSEVF